MTQIYVILSVVGWAWAIVFFAVYGLTGRRDGKT
jgi:hypothetical protein